MAVFVRETLGHEADSQSRGGPTQGALPEHPGGDHLCLENDEIAGAEPQLDPDDLHGGYAGLQDRLRPPAAQMTPSTFERFTPGRTRRHGTWFIASVRTVGSFESMTSGSSFTLMAPESFARLKSFATALSNSA